MSYKALYRKYRSQNFDELVGQNVIVETLKNSLKNNKIAHAYLFSGPRGTGKTSVARLFAKALNCLEGIGHQCNECSSCIGINNGTNPDVIEIDAASNSGVDEVRNLIDNVKYLPLNGKYKIYIIDEVHMMTNNAFNALLKTLEEPPSYVIFILCTTEPYKLLPTILSRCQRYEFNKISNEDLRKLIINILKKENVEYEIEALNLIIEIANGGARDCLSILDQVLAYSPNKIKVSDIQSVFGLTSNEEKIKFFSILKSSNTLELLEILDKFIERNIDINRLNNELLFALKDALLYSKTNNKNILSYISENDAIKINQLFNENILMQIIDILLEAQQKIKFASDPNFIFEIYSLKILEKLENKIVEKTFNFEEKPAEPQLKVQDNKEFISIKEKEPIEYEEVKIEEKEKIVIENPEEINQNKEKIKVMNFNTILETEGEIYKIDTDTLIKIMVTGKKEIRKKYTVDRDSKLDNFLDDEIYGPVAYNLKDAKPYIVTDTIFIISYDFDNAALKNNIKNNQKYFEELIEKMYGKKYFVYGLNRSDLHIAMTHYYSLQQINKLPSIDEIGEIVIN